MTALPGANSDVIANLDAGWPTTRMAAGQGGSSRIVIVDGTIASSDIVDTDTAGTGSVLKVVRIPSNCCVKKVEYVQDSATTTTTWDVGLYYSDATDDGTQKQYQGTKIVDDLFASAYAGASIVEYTDITFQNASYLPSDTRKQIWDAAGLSGDPGGYFDVTLTLTTTVSGSAAISLRVTYTTAP
jgi:hypothetical protein